MELNLRRQADLMKASHGWQALLASLSPPAGSPPARALGAHTPHPCPSALAKSTPLFPEPRGDLRLEPRASAAAPPGGRPGPRSPQGRVRPRRPPLGVGAPDSLPSPIPLPAPAWAPPLSGPSPPSGPLGPDLTRPPAPEERRRGWQGTTRPGLEHQVLLSLGGGLTTSIAPAPPRTRPPPRTVPTGPPAAHTRCSNRSPSVFGASLPPARPDRVHTTPRPGAAPILTPLPPAIAGQLPTREGAPHPERAIPRRRPRPRPLASGTAMGEGARRGPCRPRTRRRAGSAAARKHPASSRPPEPGTPAPPPPGQAATLRPPPTPPPAYEAGAPRGLSPRGAPRSPMAGPRRRTRGREAARAGGRAGGQAAAPASCRPSVPSRGWRGRRRGALGGAR